MNVIAKIAGYHPASGLHLEIGERYTIDESVFSDEVFSVADKSVKKQTGGDE